MVLATILAATRAVWSFVGGLVWHALDGLFRLIPPKAWPYIAGGVLCSVVGWQACYVFYGVPALKADRAILVSTKAQRQALQSAIRAGQQKVADQTAMDENLAWKAGYDAGRASQAIVNNLSPTILKVPYAISREADAACPVPWGFVRLWDAYATGADLDTVRARVAPGQPDDAKSDVSLSEIAALLGTVAVRYHQNADQLNRLEGFERAAGK